ncbi:MAG: TIM-barrel domain-containing protein [Pseudomonadota bacterium]
MVLVRAVSLWVVCLLSALTAPVAAREYLSHDLAGQTLSITTSEGAVSLRALSDDAVEVHYLDTGSQQLPSFALSGDVEPVEARASDNGAIMLFHAGAITVIIEKQPFRLRFMRDGKELLSEEAGLVLEEDGLGFRFNLTDQERLWGGGQRVLGMDRRGEILPLDNRGAYNYSGRTDVMYYGIPAVISDNRYLLLFDNSGRGAMDLGKTEPGIMEFEAKGGRSAYVVVAGDKYSDIVTNFVGVTGRQPLPPRWAFGNMASRFGYRTQAQTEDVVAKHFEDDFPLDAVILDLFWFGPDIKGHMGNLDWDRNAFAQPEKMIADFQEKGVKTILITEPFILSSSNRWEEALANNALARDASGKPVDFDFYFGNGGLVDMFDPAASDWFWSKNQALLDQGVAGIWGDLGEPEAHPSQIVHTPSWGADLVHNAYGHQWARIMAENWRKTYPEQRPFLMMRSGFAGSQRYGMIPWSGDVKRSWEALQAQIEIALQMSVMGLAYSHSDLGGFVSLDHESDDPEASVAFDKELYIRWLQFGAFQPVFRPHAQEQIPSEPVFKDEQTRDIVRRYIKTRYRLLPYLYTTAWQNSQTGMPMTRPLAFESDDASYFEDQSAFLWGDAMLVAPVTEKGASAKSVKLPKGVWFDLWSDTRHHGGEVLSVPVMLDDIPVFVRAGAFVPMIDDISTTRDYSSEKLTLHYYHDASITASSGQMYEDDGELANAHDSGAYELLTFQSEFSEGQLALGLNRQRDKAYEGQPEIRQMEVVIHNWNAPPEMVRIDGQQLPAVDVSYSGIDRVLKLRFAWEGDDVALEVR